jgi:type IX secretion system PorP/SprF family membrane protein
MKKYFFLLTVVSAGVLAHGQQLQTSSFYDQQGVFQNPSTAGVLKHSVVGATYRSQWSSISGSPKTATIFGSMALPQHNIGLGAYLYNDKTGPTSRTGIDLAFAKHIPMEKGTLSLGVDAKFQQYQIDMNKLSQTLGGSDPVLGGGDSKFNFDAGFGISYTSEKLQIGASVAQLVQSKLAFYDGTSPRTEEGKLYRHYFFHGHYKWKVDESTTIVPNFLMVYLPNAPLEFQGGARVEHDNIFWWGVSMRAKQSWLLSAGFHVNKKLTLGYSFEIYKTPTSVYGKGSNAHELLFSYDFLK